jgi:hypothetical protein
LRILCILSLLLTLVYNFRMSPYPYRIFWFGCGHLNAFMVFIIFLFSQPLFVDLPQLSFIGNKYLLQSPPHSVPQSIEWAYAFDIHCNSFFPLFLILYGNFYNTIFTLFLRVLIQLQFFIYFLSRSLIPRAF